MSAVDFEQGEAIALSKSEKQGREEMKRILRLTALAAAIVPAAVMAMGGASGPKTTYEIQGHLGEIVSNPYEVAPLTAIIRNGGYQVKDAVVTVLPKPNG